MDRLLLVGVIQSLFAGMIILFKRDRQKHESILGAWLLLIALQMFLEMLGIYYKQVRIFDFHLILLPMLQGPFILLYTRFLTSEKPSLRRTDLLHLLPILYGTVLFIAFIDFTAFTSGPYGEMSKGSRTVFLTYGINSVLINLGYVIFALRMVRQYRQNIENRFSVSDAGNNMGWLRFVQVVSLLVPLLMLLSGLLYVDFIALDINAGYPMNLCLVLLSFIMGYFGYRQQGVFPVEWISLQEKAQATGKSYRRSGLSGTDETALMDRIRTCMNETSLYLDSEITIYKIANVLDVPHYHITQAINRVEGKNFYTYINELRINEIKQRMQEDRSRRFTLLALALDCGFNSKTTFNTVFKKFEGKTPSQFKADLDKLQA